MSAIRTRTSKSSCRAEAVPKSLPMPCCSGTVVGVTRVMATQLLGTLNATANATRACAVALSCSILASMIHIEASKTVVLASSDRKATSNQEVVEGNFDEVAIVVSALKVVSCNPLLVLLSVLVIATVVAAAVLVTVVWT